MKSLLRHFRFVVTRLCGMLVLASAPLVFAADEAPSPAPLPSLNGDFESPNATSAWPSGWATPDTGASRWETSPDGRFLSLRASPPGQLIMSRHSLELRPEWRALEIRLRARCTGLVPGSAAWQDARVAFEFTAADKSRILFRRAIAFREDTGAWVERRIRFSVPRGAARLEILPALLNVKQGTFDLDDVSVSALDPRALLPAEKAADDAVNAGREAASSERWPSELRVAGNRLHDRNGKEVWLQGVNVVSLEWLVTGEHLLRALDAAVDDWKSNVVRLPLTEKFWFGQGPRQTDGGYAYRARVDEAIAVISGRGAYVVLDLHGFGAPTERHAEFWHNAASRYRDHPAVLFDLFNEPNSISWEVWRNGGFVADPAKPATASDAASASPAGFQSVGMQRLVDVVRATGARNLVIAGGLDWAYDLTGVAKGFALEDKGGNGVVYSAHIYSWKRDWEGNVMAVAKDHPVFLGEVGCDIKKMSFVPPERHESPYTWAPDMIGYIQKHRLNWTAFSFHPAANPILISDWKFTPTPFWGEFVKRALAGESFELKNTR